jgi:hypothetical protein
MQGLRRAVVRDHNTNVAWLQRSSRGIALALVSRAQHHKVTLTQLSSWDLLR